jgi:hypothetical protein
MMPSPEPSHSLQNNGPADEYSRLMLALKKIFSCYKKEIPVHTKMARYMTIFNAFDLFSTLNHLSLKVLWKMVFIYGASD